MNFAGMVVTTLPSAKIDKACVKIRHFRFRSTKEAVDTYFRTLEGEFLLGYMSEDGTRRQRYDVHSVAD